MKFAQLPVSAFGASAFSRVAGFGFRFPPLLVPLLLLAACHSTPPQPPLHRYEFSHPAMGTLITITLYAPEPAAAKAAATFTTVAIHAGETVTPAVLGTAAAFTV